MGKQFDAIYKQLEINSINNKDSIENRILQNASFLREREGVYLFISIDLVNSTLFKSRYKKYWPFVIKTFYKIVKNAVGPSGTNRPVGTDGSYQGIEPSDQITYLGEKDKYNNEKTKTDGFKIWKLVGDEVLVYHKIVSIREVINTIRIMNYLTKHIVEYFEHFCSRDGNGFLEEEKKEVLQIIKRHLAAKTTMWVAMCGASITLECPNMFYNYSSYCDAGADEEILDFLGPDMDAGFRLCEYAEKNKVIISPNLVAILATHVERDMKEETELKKELEDSFRIVAYVKLEDVWDKRLYPVFMYNTEREKWKDLFEYDERQTSRLAHFIFDNSEDFHTEEYTYKKLEKIYKDLGRYDEIEQLKNNFIKQIDDLANVTPTIPQEEHKFEFHISCLCYDKERDKVWICDHLHHGLSFGCIKIDMNHDYLDVVKDKYKQRYNINIVVKENPPLLSLYSVNRNEGKEEVLGVIIFVEGTAVDRKEITQKNGWYSLEKAKKIGENPKKKKIKEYSFVLSKVEEHIHKLKCA